MFVALKAPRRRSAASAASAVLVVNPMIARTPEQPLQALSSESGADSRVAVVVPGENVGNAEQPPESGTKPSWGILTSVPASRIARRRRPEKRGACPVSSADPQSVPEQSLRERLELAAWKALARQIAARTGVSPYRLHAADAYWRLALRGYGFSHLHCARCRQDEVVPFLMQGMRLPPAVQHVPHGGHGAVADRLPAAGRVVPGVQLLGTASTQLAARVR